MIYQDQQIQNSAMDRLSVTDYQRSASRDSEASLYLDAQEDFDDNQEGGEEEEEEDDDEYELLAGDDATFTPDNDDDVDMHPLLYKDMENILLIYGEKSLNYRLFKSIDEIDIELNIPLGFLEEETAEAWGLNIHEPLVVRLHLCLSRYIQSSNVPKLEVLQTSRKEKFGFGSQVRKVLENFIQQNWINIRSDYQASLSDQQIRTKKSKSYPMGFSKTVAEKSGSVDDDALAKLMEMGYECNIARNALIITHGDINEAFKFLDAHGSDLPENVGEILSPVAKPATSQRQQSHPPLLKQLRRMLPKLHRGASMTQSVTDSNLCMSTPLEDLNLLPQSTLDGRNAKNKPSISEGFLVQVFRYVRQRVPTLNEYCVICDEQHVFQNGAMLKPSVCSRELCVFAFQTLGVMADAAENISTGAEVVDLLIMMSRAAANSNRCTVILDPFPTIVDPSNPSDLMFTPRQPKYDEARKVIAAIPPMMDMAAMTGNLKKHIDEIDRGAYPMLQWIINSNRSHIVKLPQERQLSFMHTPHQFLLLSSPPAKEAAFREAKRKHKSTFAFHGSSVENWHSIIRHGLKNASGTRLQVNGAAYGKGIYLSPLIATSMGYSRMGYSSHMVKKSQSKSTEGSMGDRFLKSDSITCIAICEVIESPQLKKNSSIWVCAEPAHVCTRFFFVYENGQVSDSSIDTQKEEYKEQIKKACHFQHY